MDKEPVEPVFYAKDLAVWRSWLENNGETKKEIYLIIYNKKSNVECVGWHDAIENALCFGWVDSKAKKRDEKSCYLRFTPRNPKSNWGKRNIERANKLIKEGKMTKQGMDVIEYAKTKGKWKEE
jgi:uncharacterized protein YdeI (YjbR/CyaY-like superfamily)